MFQTANLVGEKMSKKIDEKEQPLNEAELNSVSGGDMDLSLFKSTTTTNTTITNTNTQNIHMPITQNSDGDQIVCGINIANASSGANTSSRSSADMEAFFKLIKNL